MAGRGTYSTGLSPEQQYKTVGEIDGVKILVGNKETGMHRLPEEAHSSKMYLRMHNDGTMRALRIYGDDHYLHTEIEYHPEPTLTGDHRPVLHVHYYDKNFKRTDAAYLDRNTFEKYKKYMRGREWYD